jgi:dCMP deaminase
MTIVLYVPALHRGYVELFKKYQDQQPRLLLVGEELLAQFPRTLREVRSISPEIMQTLLRPSGYFSDVSIATPALLAKLAEKSDESTVLAEDAISQLLAEQYFGQHRVIKESIFLRYDENITKNTRKEVDFDGTISQDEFDRSVINQLEAIKEQSSDHFLRVAAAIVKDGKVLAATYNHRLPSPHDHYLVGDVRNFVDYGTDPHLRTTLHAEQSVLAECAKKGIATDGASIYMTTFACPDCCNIIAEAGLVKVYFKDGYSQLSSDQTLRHYGIEIIKVD